MDRNTAISKLANGHAVWKVPFAKEIVEAVGCTWNNSLVQKFKSDPPGTFKGLQMNEGQEDTEGVDGLTLAGYIYTRLKLKGCPNFIGRGFQAQGYADSIAKHFKRRTHGKSSK